MSAVEMNFIDLDGNEVRFRLKASHAVKLADALIAVAKEESEYVASKEREEFAVYGTTCSASYGFRSGPDGKLPKRVQRMREDLE